MSKPKPIHQCLDEYHVRPSHGSFFRAWTDPEVKPFIRARYMKKLRDRAGDFEMRWESSRMLTKSWKERRKTQYRSTPRKVQEIILKIKIHNSPNKQNIVSQFATSDEWKETPLIRSQDSRSWRFEFLERYPDVVIQWTQYYIEPENPDIEIHRAKIYGNAQSDVIYELFQELECRINCYGINGYGSSRAHKKTFVSFEIVK